MSAPKDRLFRHLAILRLIPRFPRAISTTELLKKLQAEQFDIDLRSLQRDLAGRLSMDFPLLCDESQRPYRWSFPKDAPQLGLPALDIPTAMAFFLAECHLVKLLPPSVLSLLEPHFDIARRQIQGLERNSLAHWVECVRSLPNGKALQPAEIDPTVWAQVAFALMEKRQLEVRYLSRSKGEHKSLRIHPAGFVSRHSVSYLIGTVDGYSDIRQFALHRMEQASCLDATAGEHPDFDIDCYINSGGFNNHGPVDNCLLVADVSPQIAWLLRETPLSVEQAMHLLPNSDWQQLRAWVPNDQETLWWLFGLGESVRLHEPKHWVDVIKEKLTKMSELYALSVPHQSSIHTDENAYQEAL